MYQLIIAEKPSVAQSIAAVLGASLRREGYIEGNNYIVSWCFGHLAELASAETYNIEYAKWRYSDLPIVPQPWRFKVSRDKYKQFEVLKMLMRRDDIGEVVNACDAGREGELIFRTAYQLAGCSKPVNRLWISSMEDEAIRSGFQNLRPGSDYDSLYQSALCRAKADWLVGINATRLFSTLYHRTLNVGRVMSPTLALIVEREAEIGVFKSKPFYTINLEFDTFSAVSDKYSEKARAEAVAETCHEDVAKITKVERKEKSEKAPALYDLTTLQRDANRALGYTAQQTLDYLQSLYEKKLCTYPRTDARFLTDDMESGVAAFVSVAAALCKVDVPASINAKQVCDSGKVSDHHAILATVSAGKADITALPAGEREILLLIARRVLCAVEKPYRYTETTVQMMCRGVPFYSKGKTVLDAGWKAYVTQEKEEVALPELSEGDVLIPGEEIVKEGKTTPPKRFTEDTLLAAMETAGEKDMPENAENGNPAQAQRSGLRGEKEGQRNGADARACEGAAQCSLSRRGLGTPATRAAILEKLVNTGFVERKKAKKTVSLVPSHTGVSLVTVLPEQLQSPLLTAEWEQQLKQIERGELDSDSYLNGIIAMLQELVQTYKVIPGAEVLFPSGRESVGRCPRCGGDVTESKKGFFCEKNDCRFGLWRDNKFLTAKKVTLTKQIAAALLKDGRVKLTGLYSEKTGGTYDAAVVLEDDGQRLMYKLVFDNG